MKILLCHNSYQHYGGEDTVFKLEQELLTSYGETVDKFLVENSEINTFSKKLSVSINTVYSERLKVRFQEQLNQGEYDIVHVHNFFPLLTPSIFDACIDEGVPVVQTLHNYRLICPGALLMRNGKICENCVTGSPYQAIFYKCYKNSYMASAIVANMVSYHRRKGTWNSKVDRFIALTDFAKNKFIEAGFPAGKISIKPNFVKRPLTCKLQQKNKNQAIFVGRISEEKGISLLLESWNNSLFELLVIGDGPLLRNLNDMSQANNISFMGSMCREDVFSLMEKSLFLVVPSTCYETFGMTIIEAFSCGVPVICSNIGAMAEIVEDGITGIHFEVGNANDLAEKLTWATTHPTQMQAMGENARRVYEEKYTSKVNYNLLINIYHNVIGAHKERGNV